MDLCAIATNRTPGVFPTGGKSVVVPIGNQTGADLTQQNDGLTGSVERFPATVQSRAISDELNRILAILREAAPVDAIITFDFDGKLHVHIDVRKREEVTLLEAMLPNLSLGLFHSISHGEAPHHRFFHRISAIVDR